MKFETKEELEKELAIIDKWEKDQKGLWFWERIGRIPFKLLDKLTPDFIQKKLGVMLDEIGSYIQNGGKYLTKEAHILNQLQAKNPELNISALEDVSSIPLHIMDSVSQDIKIQGANWQRFKVPLPGLAESSPWQSTSPFFSACRSKPFRISPSHMASIQGTAKNVYSSSNACNSQHRM